jgi:hypothetical protein
MVKYGSSDQLPCATEAEEPSRVDPNCRLAIDRVPDDVGDHWNVPLLGQWQCQGERCS